MAAASPTTADPKRLVALRRYRILNSPDEEPFDRIVDLAAHLFDAPMAGIHFIDEDCQWAKAQTGIDQKVVSLDLSFCVHALDSTDLMVVEDAAQDDRFADHPAVVGPPAIRFYAGAPLVSPDGYVLGSLCVLDTAPRPDGLNVQQQETLRQLADVVMDELEYRAQPRHREDVLESITDAFIAVDNAWRFTYLNQRAAALIQQPRGELLGQPLWEALPQAEASAFETHLKRSSRTQESVQFEAHVPKLDKWFHVNAYPFEDGVSIYLDDCTEAHDQREALEEERERVSMALTGADLGMWDWNMDTGEVIYDERWAEMLGYSLDEVEATKDFFERHTHPDDRARVFEAVERHAQGDIPLVDLEIRMRHRDGSWRWILDRGKIVERHPDGRPHRMVGTHMDITARKRSEHELMAAKDRAEEMNRLKTAFLANMSHEIRTPLTSIIGFADVLSGHVDDTAQELLQMIRQSGERLEQTLTSILDLAQLESEKIRVEHEPIDLVNTVRSAAELFQQRAARKEIDLALDTPDPPVDAMLDPRVLRRILSNLLANAVKFTDEGSVRVRLHDTGRRAVIQVEDTGVGIDADQVDRIFNEFAQESEGYTRDFEGVGIGLAITQRLVQLLGGSIEVTSKKGVGSVFTVTLPTDAPATADGAPHAQPKPGATPTTAASTPPAPASDAPPNAAPSRRADPEAVHVLLVDDNAMTRKVLPLLLAKTDDPYVMDTATGPDEALAQASSVRYDLFLIDINLGTRQSGIDVMNQLRAQPQYTEAPMIACTAYAMPGDEEQFLSEGFDAYLAKPFRTDDLMDALHAVR